MIEIFYEGYAFTIEKKSYCDEYFSTITLASDRKHHFWSDDVVADSWEKCLIQSLKACDDITKDYGFSPNISIGEVFLDFLEYLGNPEYCEDGIPF